MVSRVAPAWWSAGLLVLCLWTGIAPAQPVEATTPAALRERYATLRAQADRNPFPLPLVLQSSETPERLQGEVLALVDRPYAEVRDALSRADHWCGLLILHLNVKYCRPAGGGPPEVLDVGVGRKFDQPLQDVYWVRFDYRVTRSADDWLQVVLQAPTGPLSTRDYRIMVEATPMEAGRTLVHMTYSYAYGMAARWAMQVYLGTLGSDKVGFSVIGLQADGKPKYVGGVRGVVERNTMRYYLAIQSYLGALALPPAQQQQRSLEDWFDATERHALQLHEVDRAEYLDMKRRELERQRTTAPPTPPR
jgi:hypothetical protein